MKKIVEYDSGINVIGSIPDYSSMSSFICEYSNSKPESEKSFSFRTHKTFTRFLAAIKASILQFANTRQKKMFLSALADDAYTPREKSLILFWQLTYANRLFRKITEEVFMKAVYQGRTSLSLIDVLSLLHYIKEKNPKELDWSEATLKITASKYLTILKKLDLADGKLTKEIRHPIITSRLFIYFIRWILVTDPKHHTINHPLMVFCFYDKQSLIERLKKIEFMPFWNITQIGEDVTIELIDHDE